MYPTVLLVSETSLPLRRFQRVIITWFLLLHTLYSYQTVVKLELSQQIFFKNPQISNFMEIHPVGAELFHADRQKDGQMDMT